MDLYEKLNCFLKENDKHAFLLYGPWGVGKTFSVDLWLENIKEDYLVIKLSLFGISSVNELNSMALSQESFRNKVVDYLKSINQNITLGIAGFSIGLPLLGCITNLFEKKHGNEKFLFVIDDIERKDNKLSIEEIFGFVDSLPKSNTKVILISNLDEMQDSKTFVGFKEKVIQEEFYLSSPTNEAIKKIIGEEYFDFFINHKIPIKNLRTLERVKKIINVFKEKIDYGLLECVYLCCLNFYEDVLGKDDLFLNYKNEKMILYHLSERKEEDYDKKIKNEALKLIESFTDDWEYLYENIKMKKLLNCIKENEIKKFVKEVYSIVISGDYESLLSINVPARKTILKIYADPFNDVFYSSNPNKKYLETIKLMHNNFISGNYDLMDLFVKFCALKQSCHNFVNYSYKIKKKENDFIDLISKLLSKYIFENYNYIDRIPFSYYFDRNIPAWFNNLSEQIVKSYVEYFNRYYLNLQNNRTFDLFELNDRINVIKNIFGVESTAFKIDELFVKEIVKMKRELQKEIDETYWRYCRSLVEWIFNNKDKYGIDKTIESLSNYSTKKSLSGKRISILLKNK